MLRHLTLLLTAAAALLAQAPAKKAAPSVSAPAKAAPELNKVKMEAFIRHLYVWPAGIEVTIFDPQPGPMANFYNVKIRGSQGNASQDETFLISRDGQKIIRGSVFDISQNPFKSDLNKIHTEYQPSEGTPGAPVVIVEFSDFECPYCREEAKILRDNLLKTYPKEVRLYYLDFPLDSIHPWAKAASQMGRCVFHQNATAFWAFNDWIFENQNEIKPENLKDKVMAFGAANGVDSAQLGKCIDSHATDDEVEKTIAQGKALEIASTPTLFVNGRRMVGASPWPDLKRVIDYEIEYQKTAKNAGEDCGCDVTLPMPGMPAKDNKGLGFRK